MTLLIITIVLIVLLYGLFMLFSGVNIGDVSIDKKEVMLTRVYLTIPLGSSIGLAFFLYKQCKKKDILGFKRFGLVLLIPCLMTLFIAKRVNETTELKRQQEVQKNKSST